MSCNFLKDNPSKSNILLSQYYNKSFKLYIYTHKMFLSENAICIYLGQNMRDNIDKQIKD